VLFFKKATAWKKYYRQFIALYLKGRVLEVGSGIGGTTNQLCDGTQEKWLCLEPDPDLFSTLEKMIHDKKLPACCSCLKGTTSDLSKSELFDAVIYIDVIEHIENDKEELTRAKELIKPNGHLVILVPAHQFLYNKFDSSIGHYRRYNKKSLNTIVPEEFHLLKMRYLDSCGYISALVNKYFLKQDYATATQIDFWDKILVPLSKVFDFISNYSIGKTLVAVWQKK
jgi:2-polyprenyl-3-methyl-5-hydroxy-6-metoxy-1,4-benzoquinol methylase